MHPARSTADKSKRSTGTAAAKAENQQHARELSHPASCAGKYRSSKTLIVVLHGCACVPASIAGVVVL
jgi:hypothetical protein